MTRAYRGRRDAGGSGDLLARHALTTQAVDIVLAALLLLGSVSGAQIGTRMALKFKPDLLRLALAAIVLLVALRMLYGLGVRPDEIYSVAIL